MSLADGSRLGSYEILSALGAGGMGEVYRARDTRLGRLVAIKILPQAFVADAERVARFQREAKVLASLNHPHIAAIYGLDEADGIRALVMELVEGEDQYPNSITPDGTALLLCELRPRTGFDILRLSLVGPQGASGATLSDERRSEATSLVSSP